jgi:hypothetical protein
LEVDSAYSKHSGYEFIKLLFSVAPDSAVLVWVSLLGESLLGRGKLEGPEEVVCLFEVRSHGDDLVDQVLNAGDSSLTEGVLNDGVVSKGDSGSVDLAVPSLVDQLGNVLLGQVSVHDERLDSSEHVDGGLVELDEDSVVELSESQELHDLLACGGELVDTKGGMSVILNRSGELIFSMEAKLTLWF